MSQYNLRSANFPVLMGRPLQLFAAALDNPLLRPLLLPQLLKNGGVPTLRALRLPEPPTYTPLHPSDQPFQPTDFRQFAHDAGQRMVPEGVVFRSVRDFSEAYRRGTTTPLAIAEKLLAAIAESDTGERPLRAITATHRNDILTQATASTQRIQAKQALSVFDGVPIVIKEELDVQGYPTTVGTRFLGQSPAREDAAVVARLRAAGALIIGKSNMHEIGISPTSDNLHAGTVRNPYHLDHQTGGSSSGSAAAVASGLCPVAIGADGGGSIRIPAALCGVVGLKPTYGRLSEHGAFPLDWSIAHLGPIGATLEDVVLAFAVMAGPDPRDPNSTHQPPLNADDWLNDWLGASNGRSAVRLGIYREWFNHAQPEIVSAAEQMLAQLAQHGATIHEIEIPHLDEMRIAHATLILSEMAASMADYPDHWRELMPTTRISLAIGKAATAVDYVQAQRVRTRALAVFAQLFEEVDVIVSPATAVVAPFIPPQSHTHGRSDLNTVIELMRFAVPGNLTGLPAITFPIGYTTAGLPISLQAMGRAWDESTLFRVAHAAENLMNRQLPPLYFDLLQ